MTHLFYTPTLATEDLAVSRVTSAPGITDGHTHKGMRVHARTHNYPHCLFSLTY